jgi:parvulin-like peptidyl-prolyl isomerase
VGAAFGVEVGKTSGLIETDEGLYVLKVLKREPADSAEFVKRADEFRARQISLARQDRVRSYMAALKTAAKIEDRRAAIFSRTEAQAAEAQAKQRS